MTIESPPRRTAAASPPLSAETDALAAPAVPRAPAGPSDASPLALRRPALWASIPATALLILLWSGGRAIGPRFVAPVTLAELPIASGEFDGTIDPSQTLVVAPVAGHTFLRGKLTYANAIAAQSPIAGRISRVMVHTGQNVQLNEPILSFANGETSRGTMHAQRLQSSAEEAQVDAVNQQSTLQERMQNAQKRLSSAKARVAAAQHRVEEARELVARLGRGEEVRLPRQASAGEDGGANDNPMRDGAAPDRAAASPQVAAAESLSRQAQQKLAEARDHEQLVQDQFDAGDAGGSQVDAARHALRDAETAANEAAARAESTRRDSQAVATGPAPHAEGERSAQNASSGQGGHRVTVAEAGQFVHDAIAESDAAVGDVDRITDEIDGYENGVSSTKERLDATGENLGHAQQVEEDAMIRAGLATVRAPTSGIVLEVARENSDVRPGEPVVTVGQPGQWEIRVQDYSANWMKLKPGDIITAVVRPGSAPAPVADDTPSENGQSAGHHRGRHRKLAAPDAELKPVSIPARLPAQPFYVKAHVKSIKPPLAFGAPAVLEATIDGDGEAAGLHLQYGMDVTCLLQSTEPLPTLAVPASALMPSTDGNFMVAVLDPVGNERADGSEVACHVEFRPIVLGNAQGVQQEIVGGLSPGERIALQPRELYDYQTAHGADAIVQLKTA